jgi:ribosomal protein S18 acetylase RimI-like enzyme
MLQLTNVADGKDIPVIHQLFIEYQKYLGIDLCFQNFDNELAALPGVYAPAWGRLLLAQYDGKVAGCVALRKMTRQTCEMKRLYVRPEFRGKGIGKELAVRIIEEAKQIGYKRIRLDTLPVMKEAIALYRRLGFKDTTPYYHNPIEGTIYMELKLS